MSPRRRFGLDPQVIFLNHGSFGACPRGVLRVYQQWQRELERQPVEFLTRRLEGLLGQVRERLGREFGCHPDHLALVSNATTGMSIVARSLPLEPGDTVLSTDHEHPSVNRGWQAWGACLEHCTLPLPLVRPEDYVETVWRAVTPRTRVLSLSHLSSPTALILPVGELLARARERGIWTVIDGAHVPGHLPLNLELLGADFYVGDLHKWVCAPKGVAFLYARPSVQPLLRPLAVGLPWRHGSPLLDLMSQGTRDLSAFLSVPAALDFLRAHHGPAIRQTCRERALKTRRRLLELLGGQALAPDEWLGQMATLALPRGTQPQALQDWLYRQHRIEVWVRLWAGRPVLRLSVQSYNAPRDLDRLVEALGAYPGIQG